MASILMMRGISVRRPKKLIIPTLTFSVKNNSSLNMVSCVVDNDGAVGSVIYVQNHSNLNLYSCVVKGGTCSGILSNTSSLLILHSKIIDNLNNGILAFDSIIGIEDSYIIRNQKTQISLHGYSGLLLSYCDIRGKSNEYNRIDIDEESSVRSKGCVGDDKFLEEILPYTHRSSSSRKRVLKDENSGSSKYDDFSAPNILITEENGSTSADFTLLNDSINSTDDVMATDSD